MTKPRDPEKTRKHCPKSPSGDHDPQVIMKREEKKATGWRCKYCLQSFAY